MSFLSGKNNMLNVESLFFVVVTPNYNMADYLEETIESVLKNLRPEDEYFIVDGGSTDGSVDIIKKYEDRITSWISEPDEGYADALRKGFDMSSAPLMCWINSGDLLLSGALALVREELSHSQADLVFGDDYYIDEKGSILQHSSGHVKNLKMMMLYGGWTPLQDACYWRRSLYDSIKGIDATIPYAADYDFFLRMSLTGRCKYFPAVLSAFRRHGSQKSVAGADAYALERSNIRINALSESNASWFNRALYRLKTYQRAHLKHMNQKKSKNIGTSIGVVSASLMRAVHL